MEVHPGKRTATECREEESFEIRVYTKGELAMLYLPEKNRKAAVQVFMSWIYGVPQLWDELQKAGMVRHAIRLTPKQVSLIVQHLGVP